MRKETFCVTCNQARLMPWKFKACMGVHTNSSILLFGKENSHMLSERVITPSCFS